MQLSIVSDELRLPQPEAFDLISRWGLTNVELRSLTGGRIPDGDVEETAGLIAQYGMNVAALSPGIFKCRPIEAEIVAGLERLNRTLPLCGRLGCGQVIVFTVQAPEGEGNPPELVVDALREAGRLAGEAGLRLALENEPGYTAVGSRTLAALIDAVARENVGGNWDPGNAWPFDPEIDDAPRILGERIFNVHAKDCAERDGKRVHVALGRGSIDWRGQIEGLQAIGYEGMVTVETHCEPGVERSRENVDILRTWLG